MDLLAYALALVACGRAWLSSSRVLTAYDGVLSMMDFLLYTPGSVCFGRWMVVA